MIVIREGNLFGYEHQAYAHGVNSRGRMDAGIAVDFKRRYPKMFRQYKTACLDGILKPGDIFFYRAENDEPDVYNLVTQRSLKRAREEFLEEAIKKMYIHSKRHDITDIAMPEIGCGLGGIDPVFLKDTINKYFGMSNTYITIYTRHAAH